MSTIIIAVILIIITIVPTIAFILMNKKNEKKRNEKFLRLFNEVATKYGLSFSRQEILMTKIIGLDGSNQALLIFEFENANNATYIDMAEVKNCTVKKEYDSINIGNEKKTKMEEHLRSIDLKIVFKNRPESISVPFYDSRVNSIYEMAQLEAKVKEWETVLSKTLLNKARA